MTPEKPVTTVGMSIRRSGARLRAMSKTHSPLHVLLWQAREAERALQFAATAQQTLFSDVADWAATENLAISDICSKFGELSALATSAQLQLAHSYKSLRKNMGMILEGEKRSDAAQRKLQQAETKRHKARRLVLQAQSRTQVTGMPPPTSPEYVQLQGQLAEAERHAERAHLSSCETKSEAEAVKLIILRSSLSKLSQCHVTVAQQIQTIFSGGQQLAHQIPDPPAPGDLLSCIRYTGLETSRIVVGNVKSQVQILSTSPGTVSSSHVISPPPRSSSRVTVATSPNWASPLPSAPENPFLTSVENPFLTADTDLPPPYNTTINTSNAVQNGGWTSSDEHSQGTSTTPLEGTQLNSSCYPPRQGGQNSTPSSGDRDTGSY